MWGTNLRKIVFLFLIQKCISDNSDKKVKDLKFKLLSVNSIPLIGCKILFKNLNSLK